MGVSARLSQTSALAVLLALLCVTRVRAAVPNPSPIDICVFGCYDWTDHITWALRPDLAASEDYYHVLCSSTLKIHSIFYCSQTYCNDEEISSGLSLLNLTCVENGAPALPSYGSVALPLSELGSVQLVPRSFEESSVNKPVDHPIIPDPHWVGLSWRTDSAFYTSFRNGENFGYACYGFWALVILIGMLHNAFETFVKNRKLPNSGIQKRLTTQSSTWLFIRRRFILPATFMKHCQEPVPGLGTVPPRLETLVISLYVIMNFVFCFPYSSLFIDNQYFGPPRIQLARYVGDRTGLLALYNFPIIWLFSARNNPLLWLTGWHFTTFNHFHRWASRVTILETIAHSIAFSSYLWQAGGEEGYDAEFMLEYMYTGGISTVAVSLMLGTTIYIFRQKSYDVFLIVHILLALIALVTLWYHLQVEPGLYDGWIWACVAIWSFDRFLRLSRVGFSSVLPRIANGTKANATYDRNAQIIRLDVTDFFVDKIITPGFFFYVYTPGSIQGYESHPFTLCSWIRSPGSSPDSSLNKGKAPIKPGEKGASPEDTRHSFLIRPYDGFTGRLRQRVESSHAARGSSEVTIFLEGPYGKTLDLSRFSDVLLVAGGSGITIAVSHAHFLLAEEKSTRVHLAWAVPQRRFMDDVCEHELASVLSHPRFRMTVYVTGEAEMPAHPETPADPDAPTTSDESSGKELQSVAYRRPDIYAVMKEAREESTRNLAVVSCGTRQMADECRAAIVRLLEGSGPDVEYYNETMTW